MPPHSSRAPRITDRQVEIMTATLCDVIAHKKLPPDEGKVAIGELIRAMVAQVSRLNEAIASYGAAPEVATGINAIGLPIATPTEES